MVGSEGMVQASGLSKGIGAGLLGHLYHRRSADAGGLDGRKMLVWWSRAGAPEPEGPMTGAEVSVLVPALALAVLVVRSEGALPSLVSIVLMALALSAMGLVLLRQVDRLVG